MPPEALAHIDQQAITIRDIPDLLAQVDATLRRGEGFTLDTQRRAMARLKASDARICFVALGAPKQEIFSDRAFASGQGTKLISSDITR